MQACAVNICTQKAAPRAKSGSANVQRRAIVWHMAPRKSDAEVGPAGVWAYNTRTALGLSAEEVSRRVHYSPATIRKVEGGSNPRPSRALLTALYRLYVEVGEEVNVPVKEPPGLQRHSPPSSDLAALIAALDRQTEAITRQADLVEQLLGRWAGLVMQQTADPDVLGVLAPLVEAAGQRAAEREHPDPTRFQPATEARR